MESLKSKIITYESFNELELIGTYEGFDWSIENYGTGYEIKYLIIRLWLTDEWKISNKVTEETVLYHIKTGTLSQYLKDMFDKIIKEIKKTTDKL